ncbi:MAG: hypothetical protein IH905_12265 [Proteobacteria bacterium]|nr:hypothetical protein [Pseudomonadota bacterium]
MAEFWPFPKIAKNAAKWQHGNAWPVFEDECLHDLAADVWCNRFDGKAGRPHVYSEFGYGKYEPVTRELVWRLLGPGKPSALRNVLEDAEKPWDKLAATPPEDYGASGIRNTIIAELLLEKPVALKWIQNRPTHTPGRKTRVKTRNDAILAEYDCLCDEGRIIFDHGGLQKAAEAILKNFPAYKIDSIRKIIQKTHNERKVKEVG